MTFEEIYHQYKDMVFNLALNYVQNYEDAQEIAQDVFVSAHKALPQFRHDSNLSTWLYRITINRCLDVIRSRKRKKRFAFMTSLFDSSESPHIPHFDHPGVLLEHKETLSQLFRYINELPDNQKTALLLSKTEQMSQAEVAEIMGISPKAAESLIQRAKTNLAAKMKQNEGK